MVTKRALAASALLLAGTAGGTASAAPLEPHPDVRGPDVVNADLRPAGGTWRAMAWDDLDTTTLAPGTYEVHAEVVAQRDADTLWLPACAGRSRVAVDGREVPAPPGPVVVPLGGGRHDVVIAIAVSSYERRVACGDRPRVGVPVRSVEGLGSLAFVSPHAARGGGRTVVYVPPGHDLLRPAALLVGLHPWNGSVWTYAAYAQLFREARRRDVVLLMPSGLGNSLYTADAEDEVLRAIDALSLAVAVDPRAVSLWGASMGGAGATTIGFHHPDRFASVASFFGDSRYDLRTYVRAILPDEDAAHRVNALDVVDNARWLPVFLAHGEEDRTSAIRQSEELARAMRERGMTVRFERVAGLGHSGALVARFLADVVASAAIARVPVSPPRVTYRSTRPSDTGAYGVTLVRAQPRGDAYVDVERSADAVHVRRAEGVRSIRLARGALGADPVAPPPIIDDTHSVDTTWATPP